MHDQCLRRSGARAKICLLLCALTSLCSSQAARAAPLELEEADGEPAVLVYPSRQSGAQQVTVVLHGMCSEPVNACRHFEREVVRGSHLVCPRASQRCQGGGSIWPQVGIAQQIEKAVSRAEHALGERVDLAQGRTLIGYSQGAFRAVELAQQAAGKYPRVMLIGARVMPNPELLSANGVERLLMSAGAWDMMHDHMHRETRRLSRGGFTARFLGLGPVGHFLTPSFAQHLPEALRWLREEPAPARE